ncbi:MAG TPA: SgcJ/EcaC family oxidoreductase [Gammaproteobacteria bacterium]|nr:SgcJ/EcaC family oxidoreductase [Gammaproteobacteria bacterium]
MSSSEHDIRELMDQLARAWNAQDWTHFAGYFTADCHYVSSMGKVLSGRDQISTFLLSAVTQKRAVTLDEMSVRQPVADAALVLCRWTLQSHDVTGSPTGLPPRQGIFTATLVHDKKAWKIAALHNTDIEPDFPKE